jgi:hypothetical protein
MVSDISLTKTRQTARPFWSRKGFGYGQMIDISQRKGTQPKLKCSTLLLRNRPLDNDFCGIFPFFLIGRKSLFKNGPCTSAFCRLVVSREVSTVGARRRGLTMHEKREASRESFLRRGLTSLTLASFHSAVPVKVVN